MTSRLLLAACLLATACGHATGPESPSTAPRPLVRSGESTGPRALVAIGDGARVELVEGSGALVDGNAPPPPPGSEIARHPALHGSCVGEVGGCSRAGALVRASTTFDEAWTALVDAGFEVQAR